MAQDVHKKLSHTRVSPTLAKLCKQYWIRQGKAMVKQVLHHCLICRKYEGGPFRLPAMAPWPKERVTKATPFTYTGLDYLYERESRNILIYLSYCACHPFGNNSRHVSIQICTCPRNSKRWVLVQNFHFSSTFLSSMTNPHHLFF